MCFEKCRQVTTKKNTLRHILARTRNTHEAKAMKPTADQECNGKATQHSVVIILYKTFAHSQQDRSSAANTPFSQKLITQTLPTRYKQGKYHHAFSRQHIHTTNTPLRRNGNAFASHPHSHRTINATRLRLNRTVVTPQRHHHNAANSPRIRQTTLRKRFFAHSIGLFQTPKKP